MCHSRSVFEPGSTARPTPTIAVACSSVGWLPPIAIVLRRAQRVIACEVCARNALEYELGNVRKCLEAGFRQVVVVCPNRTKLGHIQEAIVAALPAEQIALVTCFLPDDFIRKLFDWAGDDPEGGATERGKRRKQTNQSGWRRRSGGRA